MPDFETWLQDTRNRLAAISGQVTTLQSDLSQTILSTNGTENQSANVYNVLKSLSAGSGDYFVANEGLRQSLYLLAYTGHDAETIIDLPYFLRYMNLDLNNVLKEDIQNDQIEIKQTNTAVLLEQSDNCTIINKGYLGVVIPVKIKVFGQEKDIELSVTIYLNHDDLHSTTLQVSAANSLKFCPENAFSLELGLRFLNLARPKVEASLQNFGYTIGDLNFGHHRTILYGASLTPQYLRIFTSFGLRRKRKMPLLTQIGASSHIVIKLGNEFLTETIAAEVRKYGFNLHGGPQYTSSNTFNLELRLRVNGQVRVGCGKIGYYIELGGKVNVILSISGRNTVVMQLAKLSDPRVISHTGDDIPIIGDLISAALNRVIRDFNRSLHFRQTYIVQQNQKAMAVEITPQFLLLKLKMQ